MTALEVQFAAARGMTRHSDTAARVIAHSLRKAETFSWTGECAEAVLIASQTIPAISGLSLVDLPSRNAWWYFGTVERLPFEALCYATVPEHGMLVTVFHADSDPTAPHAFGTFTWRPNETVEALRQRVKVEYPLDQQLADMFEVAAKVILAASVWLKQRILSCAVGAIERHRRKQLARENNGPLPSDVKVIQLRRVESSSRAANPDAESVDWSCRWIVSGHWRNQPYANGERKLIAILPYVKGPADKPLKVPTHTVYAVNR